MAIVGIVEDDNDQLENYTDALRKKGFTVVGYSDRDSAEKKFLAEPPDLVILDIILGTEVDAGFDLCRVLLGRHPSLPVLFLTDRVDEIDRISGLRMGAWDYETKPISLTFLAEKTSTLLRIARSRRIQPDMVTGIDRGKLKIDEERMRVTWGGKTVDLTLTEFRIVAELARRPGVVKSYDQLMESAMQSVVTHNTVVTHVRNLRAKFMAVDPTFVGIGNEYGVGYRWDS
jgi:two-component system OmpR family response regulator